VIAFIALRQDFAGGAGAGVAGFQILLARFPDQVPHDPAQASNPHYKELPGISVLIGGLWVMNLSYWGFNQYIIQRALGRRASARGPVGHRLRRLSEAPDAGDRRAARHCGPDPGAASGQARPGLSRLMTLLPPGCWDWSSRPWWRRSSRRWPPRSIRSRPSSPSMSIADVRQEWRVRAPPGGRGPHDRGVTAVIIGFVWRPSRCSAISTRPSSSSRTRPAIVTPGIVVIFLLGMFWARATTAGAFVATVGSVALSFAYKLYGS
jgi:SSS family solute:Na+ symporter